MRTPAATLFALVNLASAALAQGTGTVRGRVVDSSSAIPRVGVSVSIVATTIIGTTRSDGRFVLARVPAGPRELRVRGIGIVEITIPVTVRDGDTTEVEVPVRPAVVSLEAMRIDAAEAE